MVFSPKRAKMRFNLFVTTGVQSSIDGPINQIAESLSDSEYEKFNSWNDTASTPEPENGTLDMLIDMDDEEEELLEEPEDNYDSAVLLATSHTPKPSTRLMKLNFERMTPRLAKQFSGRIPNSLDHTMITRAR
jgi:hypothetical protein